MTDESTYTHKEECPKCGSRDNLARYTDGHGFCFGCSHYEPATDGSTPHPSRSRKVATDFTPIDGEFQSLTKRGISEETCRHFGYTVGTRHGAKVHVAPYYKDGVLVAQHYRTANKEFAWSGDPKNCELFGQHLWRDTGKKVVITEGEIDAMTVSQLQGNKWPVVSIPSGANGAAKALRANLEWLERFEEVILMFDGDEPGKEAVEACAPLFTPGRCKVASLPHKDPNECLQKGAGAAVIEALWGAKPFRPDGVVAAADLAEAAAEDVPEGYPWFLLTLTKLTHGRRDGEVYALGAGTGVGKTDVFTQSIAYDIEQGFTVGALYLEQATVETVRRVAGKMAGKVFHVPGMATKEERAEAVGRLGDTGRLYLYDNFGAIDWETVKSKLRYMVVGLGCKMIYLDHLTALVAQEDDEKKSLDAIMSELAGIAKETSCVLHFISHLATPEGKSHEEGGRVTIRNFRGSRSIGFWSYFMFGLERDQQAEDGSHSTTVFRVLKDRVTGQATGKTIHLAYDPLTGLLSETEARSLFPDRTASTTNEEF